MTINQGLTADTFQTGMLVNDHAMTGVVQRGPHSYAVFTTDLLTAETTRYREFSALDEALCFVNGLAEDYHFETFGCSKGSSCKGAQRGACEGCAQNAAPRQPCS